MIVWGTLTVLCSRKAYRDNGMIAWDSLQLWENQLPRSTSVHQRLCVWTQRPALTAPSLRLCLRVRVLQICSTKMHINPWHISQMKGWKKTWSLGFYVCLLFIFPDWNVIIYHSSHYMAWCTRSTTPIYRRNTRKHTQGFTMGNRKFSSLHLQWRKHLVLIFRLSTFFSVFFSPSFLHLIAFYNFILFF